MKINLQQWSVYLIITIVSIGFLYAIESRPPLVPHGIYLPATEQSFPVHEGKVDMSQSLPPGAKIIGVINLQMRLDGNPSEAMEQEIMNNATTLAAQNGAKGIVVTYFFASQGAGNKSYLMQAQAFV